MYKILILINSYKHGDDEVFWGVLRKLIVKGPPLNNDININNV